MPDPNASLRALLGGGQNIANSRVALRNQQLQDPRTTAAFRQQVGQENADEAATQAEDPMSQRYAAIAEGQGQAAVENVPEIKAMHDQAMAEELALKTAAARTTGEFQVKAAESKAAAQNDVLEQMRQFGMAPGQKMSIAGVGSMSQAPATHQPSQSDLADRAYLTGLRTGKQHAPGYSFFSGPSQKDLDASEIAKVEGRLGGGVGPAASGTIRARDPQTGVIHTAPAGTPLPAGWELVN